jgi:DNA-binding CsgD family transcriptional regulator
MGGAYRGRKRSLSEAQVSHLVQRASSGVAKATLARELGVSRETVYHYLRAAP